MNVLSVCTVCNGKTNLHNRRICEAERETRYTKAKRETQKHEIRSLESGIIEIENKDRKTSLQQCSMNKYQFIIYPAEKLL